MNYNSELEGNNAGLRQILNAVNNLPSANGGGCVLTDEEKKEIATEAAEQLQPQLDELSEQIADLETVKIPKVFLTGDITGITKYDPKDLKIEYVDGVNDFDGYVEMKVQGASSQYYDKKNFTIKMFADSAKETKLKKDFRGWGKQNKFCLKANFIDHTHARNIVCARLWGDIVSSRTNVPTLLANAPNYGAVDGFPIKVYINGVYQGLYTWNIPKDKWTFGMDDEDTQVILACERNNDGKKPSPYPSTEFRKLWDGTELEWKIEFPDEVTTDIRTNFNSLINFVMTASDTDFVANLGNYLDIESVLDYYLFMYFICDLDGLAKNMLMAYDGTKWYCSAYDMDGVFGISSSGNVLSGAASSYVCPDSYNDDYSLLWQRIEKLMYTQLQDRYAVLRAGALSYTNIIKRFENFTDTIPQELYNEDPLVYPGIPSADTSNIRQIRDFMVKRGTYVDGCIADLDGSSFCDVNYDGVDDYKTVSSISAVFTQGGTVITTGTNLESLKSMLVVTAKYADGTTSTVFNDFYDLSGTLVAGNSTITATYNNLTTTFVVACEQGEQAGYTNLVPTAIDTDGSIYNGVGYKNGYRLSSAGTPKELVGSTVTGFIPVKGGDVVRVWGVGMYSEINISTASNSTYVCIYDASFQLLGGQTLSGGGNYGSHYNKIAMKADGENAVITLGELNTIAYIRINTGSSAEQNIRDGANMIVTVNEEIT